MTSAHRSLVEINFDGIVGPSHNYAGLSRGNLASLSHAGEPSNPRAAARQGLAKMRANLALGLTQGILVPPPRPSRAWCERLGIADLPEDRHLLAAGWSASAMWAANAATVSPAPDTADGRCHLTPANLVTMPHRSHEWPDTARQLALAFADTGSFVVHAPVPPCFGDEGAANHLRLAPRHDLPGLEIFVHGSGGGPFPARQHREASRAVARLHGLDPQQVLLVEQSAEAVAAGAFHNDVVAVSNEDVLLVHEQAFAELPAVEQAIRERLPEVRIITVPRRRIGLDEAVRSYLFNAQLVTLADRSMALIVPREAMASAAVRAWLEELIAANNPIMQVVPVDLRQSMANGGGPACLRLRVLADPATVDPRFLVDSVRLDLIGDVVARHWPERMTAGELGDPQMRDTVETARLALLAALDLTELA